MNINYERYCTKRNLKMQHGVDLTDAQLDTIEEIYAVSKKSNVLNIAFYRAINFVIGLFGSVFFFLVRGTWAERWFFLTFVIIFALYNGIHCFNTYIDYKLLNKVNEPTSEVDESGN